MTRVRLIAEVDPAELMVRMIEAAQSVQRPEGATAEEAIKSLDPVSRDWLQRMAQAAMEYVAECLSSARREQ